MVIKKHRYSALTTCLSMVRQAALIVLLVLSVFAKDAFAVQEKADKLLVLKSKRILILFKEGEILRTYRVSLGKNPEGPKLMAGDKKTPEGRYTLASKKADSKFHRAIRISYPNESDIQNARMRGVPPGGSIMIHGLSENLADVGDLHRYMDWTDGCIAVTNEEMEEIWLMVDSGTPIEIKP